MLQSDRHRRHRKPTLIVPCVSGGMLGQLRHEQHAAAVDAGRSCACEHSLYDSCQLTYGRSIASSNRGDASMPSSMQHPVFVIGIIVLGCATARVLQCSGRRIIFHSQSASWQTLEGCATADQIPHAD